MPAANNRTVVVDDDRHMSFPDTVFVSIDKAGYAIKGDCKSTINTVIC